MADFNYKAFVDALRPAFPERRIPQAQLDIVNHALDIGFGRVPVSATPPGDEPPWLIEARRLIGTREIPGPSHNSFIARGWARLGAPWYNDDETPWCGLFVAHCIEAAGLPYPSGGMFARAKSWAGWGKACAPMLGAVVVFGRQGGGHVGFLVGQSRSSWYVLGGNQKNAVNIMPLLKTRQIEGGIRWPGSLAVSRVAVPAMSGGVQSVNER